MDAEFAHGCQGGLGISVVGVEQRAVPIEQYAAELMPSRHSYSHMLRIAGRAMLF